MNTKYPEPVLLYATKVNQALEEMSFYKPGQPGAEIDPSILYESLCQRAFQLWLSGEEVILTEAQFEEAVRESLVYTAIGTLKELGMVDTILDENNKEVVFLTEAGKKAAEELK